MKHTADILRRFAEAKSLDERAKALAKERGIPFTADLYQFVVQPPCDAEELTLP